MNAIASLERKKLVLNMLMKKLDQRDSATVWTWLRTIFNKVQMDFADSRSPVESPLAESEGQREVAPSRRF
uniref:Uncharacterized protein n=1 Tax=Pristionchus pacificus TaxID=54126 RepID=A0A2A6C118_PRIPA|eukprot:PDM71864.1 hypothetical protein PRIPAC_38271 [Pristionchus pacificus]